MSNLITTSSIPRTLQPGLARIFGQAYPMHEMQFSRIFKTRKSNKNFEIDLLVGGLGKAQVKAQGGSINVDTFSQGFSPKYPIQLVGNSYWVSIEALEDEQYDVFARGAKQLKFSLVQAKEQIGANILNNAFDTNYTMLDGDGQPLLSTSHPRGPQDSTVWSNKLATPASLSRTAVEELLTQIRRTPDTRGNRISLKGTRLVVPPELEYQACTIMDSVLQPDNGNNAVNAINYRANKGYGMLRDGYMVYDYLTSATAWFITVDDVEAGLTYFERSKPTFDRDNSFTTYNVGFFAKERYAFGWSDPRGCFGSEGV